MSCKAITAKTYLKGKEVGSFIKQNYGEELNNYNNKSLLKELDEKYNISVNYNTLRKEAGRLRSTNRFRNNTLDTLVKEGIDIKNVDLEKLALTYEKNPKFAAKMFKKAEIKGISRSKVQFAKDLGMTLSQFEKHIYSESEKIKTLLNTDEYKKYSKELDNYLFHNNYVMAYRLNNLMNEYIIEEIARIEKEIEKENIEELIHEENLNKTDIEVKLAKEQIENYEKYMIVQQEELDINDLKNLAERVSNTNNLEKFIGNFKTIYPTKVIKNVKIINLEPEELTKLNKTRKDLKMKSDGTTRIIYTDGFRAWPTYPDAEGNIRDDVIMYKIGEGNSNGIIKLVDTLNGEFFNLSNNYTPSVLIQSVNEFAYPNVAYGCPNTECRNLKEMVDKVEDSFVKSFFSKLGMKFK